MSDDALPSASGLRVAENLLELIGATPLLHLKRFRPEGAAELYAKLEFLNPGGSIKDRAALGMVDAAEKAGSLRPGGTIIEPTAGNTGIGLALIGVSRGYRVIVVIPERFVGPKTAVMKILGAELEITPTEGGMPAAIDRAHALAAEIPGAYVPQQFENPANPDIHYRTTGSELCAQLPCAPDALVLGGGTGGTLTGVARRMREEFPKLRTVLVEPRGSIWGGGPKAPHRIEGIGNSFWPATLDRSLVDEIRTIEDADAFACVAELARSEGLLLGGSSGAAAVAAREIAQELGPGSCVVTLFPDGFERYLGKGVFDDV